MIEAGSQVKCECGLYCNGEWVVTEINGDILTMQVIDIHFEEVKINKSHVTEIIVCELCGKRVCNCSDMSPEQFRQAVNAHKIHPHEERDRL